MEAGNLIVLDASALLAYARGEPRADRVGRVLGSAAISSVNASEVIAVLARFTSGHAAARCVSRLGLSVVACDWNMAVTTAEVHEATRARGLSLSACACLATALRLGVPAVTADETWRGLDVGVEIQVL